MKVIVFGATGDLGSQIARALAMRGHEATAAVRNAAPSDAERQGRLQVLRDAGIAIREVQLDASLEALTQLLAGFQAVVCCLVGEALLQQKRLVDAAKAAGTVQRFIPSEYATLGRNGPPAWAGEWDRKEEVRRYLAASGLPHTIIIANGFARWFVPRLGMQRTPAPPVQLGIDDEVCIYGDGNVRALVVTLEEDIAAYTAETISDPRTADRYLFIAIPGNIFSQNELVAAWERLSGRCARVRRVSAEQLEREIAENPAGSKGAQLDQHIWIRNRYCPPLDPEDLEASALYPHVRCTAGDDLIRLVCRLD